MATTLTNVGIAYFDHYQDVGDTGSEDAAGYDEKNVVKGGPIKAGQDFHLGDDYMNSGQTNS